MGELVLLEGGKKDDDSVPIASSLCRFLHRWQCWDDIEEGPFNRPDGSCSGYFIEQERRCIACTRVAVFAFLACVMAGEAFGQDRATASIGPTQAGKMQLYGMTEDEYRAFCKSAKEENAIFTQAKWNCTWMLEILDSRATIKALEKQVRALEAKEAEGERVKKFGLCVIGKDGFLLCPK